MLRPEQQGPETCAVGRVVTGVKLQFTHPFLIKHDAATCTSDLVGQPHLAVPGNAAGFQRTDGTTGEPHQAVRLILIFHGSKAPGFPGDRALPDDGLQVARDLDDRPHQVLRQVDNVGAHIPQRATAG